MNLFSRWLRLNIISGLHNSSQNIMQILDQHNLHYTIPKLFVFVFGGLSITNYDQSLN